ncbi:hypothetical protein ES705_49525 [subsurface metagenome]
MDKLHILLVKLAHHYLGKLGNSIPNGCNHRKVAEFGYNSSLFQCPLSKLLLGGIINYPFRLELFGKNILHASTPNKLIKLTGF